MSQQRKGTYHFPPSHTPTSYSSLLLECPLDLSSSSNAPLTSHPSPPSPLSAPTTRPPSSDQRRSTKPTKTSTWRTHLIDPVLVSTQAGMLGPPFLVRGGMFVGRVYATERARTGRLMMEELVEMNDEYVRFYGWRVGETPDGLKWEEVGRMASVVRGFVAGRDGDELASWILGCLCTGHLLIRIMRVKQKLFNQLQRNFGGDQQDQFYMLVLWVL